MSIGKVFTLPGVDLTPEVLIGKSREQLPNIKHMMVATCYADDSYNVRWTMMPVDQYAMLVGMAQHHLNNWFEHLIEVNG